MLNQPSPEEILRWNRWFAVECNNRAWDLTAQSERTDAEDDELLQCAYASALHWSRAGMPVNTARAYVILAHAHSLLGHGELAMHYARRALTYFEQNRETDWDIAFAHLEMSLAASACGDAGLHLRHHALASEKGALIANEENRRAFEEELARIPAPED